MKITKILVQGFAAAALLIAGLTACQDSDIPAANTSLSYPVGEMSLGGGTFYSHQPSVRTASEPEFAITGVTHDGEAVDSSIAEIVSSTGVIAITPDNDIAAQGVYLVSVRMMNDQGTQNFPDAFKLIVRGVRYSEKSTTPRGEELIIEVDELFFAQQTGSLFSLKSPEGNADYDHISINEKTGAVTVAATIDAGVYPISINVKNRTNPDGILLKDALTITVASKPYGLTYNPNGKTLALEESYTSPLPSVRAASVEDGQSVNYSLENTFGGEFSIDAATGVVSLPESSGLKPDVLTEYKLSINVANNLGNTLFSDVLVVTIDPERGIDPVQSISYPGQFPVQLVPGQEWTSSAPTVNGSTIGIRFSLKDAPQGITINSKTGVITMGAGHYLPLISTGDNKLTVEVINGGMETALSTQVGDFSVNPVYWTVNLAEGKTTAADYGIKNMDRISYSGPLAYTTSGDGQHASAWGRTFNKVTGGVFVGEYNNLFGVDYFGGNKGAASHPDDWLISERIAIPAESFYPHINFEYGSRNGVQAYNYLEIYIVESAGYAKENEEQDEVGVGVKVPSNLEWEKIACSENHPDKEGFPAVIEENFTTTIALTAGTFYKLRSFEIPAKYKGKEVRLGFRVWCQEITPAGTSTYQRTYRMMRLRVEDSLTAGNVQEE